jgi:1-acyl-sn-glycerol-3-phosphate acyltransferase
MLNIDTIYQDIKNIIDNNKKIIIIIYPEGNIKRTCNINYDINKPNIDNFEIIEEKCFNYKKGAFEMSMMNNVPILQTIFYSPMPNYKYNFFNKEYDIKHINHIGINVYNFQKFKKGITVENYRKTMEKLFKKRYIETLIKAHRFNIVFDKKIN